MKLNIRLKLMFSLLFLVLIFIIVFTAYSYIRESHTIRGEMVKRGNSIIKTFTQMAATYMFEMDYATVLYNADELVQSGDVSSVVIIDLKGRFLIDTQGFEKKSYSFDEFDKKIIQDKIPGYRQVEIKGTYFLEFSNPVKSLGKTAYLLKMNLSLKPFEKQLAKATKEIFLISVSMLLIAIILALVLSKLLTNPVKNLLIGTREISEGNLDYRIEIRSRDEIGNLAQSFNDMGRALKDQIVQLQKAEKKYRSIFENAVEGLFQVDTDGVFISVNPSLARILGFDSVDELVVYSNALETYWTNPDDPDILKKMLLENGRVSGCEVMLYRKDNSIFLASISARPVCDDEGNLVHYEGSLVDTTEYEEEAQKELEASFRAHLSLTKAHEELEARNSKLLEANNKIMDSIRYARLIQTSILSPNLNTLTRSLPDSSIIWMPKDLVSGDFIFSHAFKDGVLIFVADCTGHGVPGALMTMIVSSGLTRIVRDEKCSDPAEILSKLNAFVKIALHQNTHHSHSDDGLDAISCFVSCFSSNDSEEKARVKFRHLIFAGARLSLFYIMNGEIFLVKGDRKSIGYRRSDLSFVFSNHKIAIDGKMEFYMLTDGFADQLGGKPMSRFGRKRFVNLLKESGSKPFEEQKDIFLNAFNDHRGEHERLDDVTMVGFRCQGEDVV